MDTYLHRLLVVCSVAAVGSCALPPPLCCAQPISRVTAVLISYTEDYRVYRQVPVVVVSTDGAVLMPYRFTVDTRRANVKYGDGRIVRAVGTSGLDPLTRLSRISVEPQRSPVPRMPATGGAVPEPGSTLKLLGGPDAPALEVTVRTVGNFAQVGAVCLLESSSSVEDLSGYLAVTSTGVFVGAVLTDIIGDRQRHFLLRPEYLSTLPAEPVKTFDDQDAALLLLSQLDLYYRGVRALWAADYAAALPLFERAVKASPEDVDAQLQVGFCQEKLGRTNDAIRTYKALLKKSPRSFDANFRLGLLYHRENMFREALEFYNAAATIRPEAAAVHYNIGLCHVKRNEIPSARRALETLAAIDEALAVELARQIP
jgi:hypothetical protein